MFTLTIKNYCGSGNSIHESIAMRRILFLWMSAGILVFCTFLTPAPRALAASTNCSARGSWVDLSGCYLYNENLANTYLNGANLSSAYLYNANLTGANLTGANFTGTIMANATLTNVISLTKRTTKWSCSLRIDSLALLDHGSSAQQLKNRNGFLACSLRMSDLASLFKLLYGM